MRNKQILLSGRAITSNAADAATDRYSFLHLSDAEPNLGTASANDYVLVYNTDANSTGNRLWSTKLITAYANANAAFAAANAAFANANGAFASANAAFANANGAFAKSNAGYIQANSAFIQANASFVHANAAYQSQNATGQYANSAFVHANSAYRSQNATGQYANAAFIRANNSLDANNGGTVTGDVRIAGNLTVTGQTTYVNTSTVLIADNIITLNAAINQAAAPTVDAGIEVDRGSSANVYVLWNETIDKWTLTNDGVGYYGIASDAAESYANSAFIKANASFDHANAAYISQNATGQYANAAFSVANGAFFHANAAFANANGAFAKSNAAYNHANSGFIQANAAFIRANNSLDANNGGTVTGNVTIVGNLTSNTLTTTGSNGSISGANAIFTNYIFAANGTVDLFIYANNAYANANAGFAKANAAFANANGAFAAANSAYNHANSAFIQSNSAFIHANSGFIHANSAYQSQNATGQYANAAFVHANSAYESQNATGQYANAAFVRANNSLDANNGGTVTGFINVTQNVSIGTYLDLATDQSNPINVEGRIFYDNTQHALAYYNESDMTFQIGQEAVLRVWNNTGATIADGKPVYITNDSSANGFPSVALASAATANTAEFIGLTTTTIVNSGFGYVTTLGKVNGLNTSLFTEGQELFLSDTPGEYQTSAAASPSVPLVIGYVVVSDVTNGSIYVHSHLMEGRNKSNGAILFGRNGTIDQDPTTLYWDYANNSLGIGTDTPQANLHVTGSGLFTGNVVISGNLNVTNANFISTSELTVTGNTIILSDDTVGTPTLNAAIIVNRGSSPNAYIRWDESIDEWTLSEGGDATHILTSGKTAETWDVYNTFDSYEKRLYPIGANLSKGIDYQANAAFTTANIAEQLAIAGFKHANSGFIHANAAFDFANTLAGGLDTVNVSITLANDHANAAFHHANASYQSQNATGQYANSAFVHANAAFEAANNALDTWVRGQANAAFIQANSSFFHANSGFIHANAAFEAANNALDTWVRGQANAAFTQANSGFIHANSAFAYANTLAGGAAIDNVARDSANSAGIYANGAFVAANVADEKAVASGNYANAAFIQANTPSYVANSAAAYANAAFIRANNSLDANNGGTVTGDVHVTGNLTVTGITTYVNTSTVLIADNILTLNAAIDQASAPTVDAGLEIDRGSSANVYMLWNETEDRWTFTNDGVSYEGVGYASTASYANSAFTVANGAFIVANAGILQANAAFFHANSAYESQNATGQYANAAFIIANSAFDHANAAYQSQNATGQYANSAFVQANASYDQANAAFIIANVAILQANAAFEVANVAILQANSAFFHANAGFITANASFNHANVAYDTANSADVYANSAYRHANGAFFHANAGFITANSAFIAANGALINAASAGAYANSAFLAANVADGKAVASGNYANAAFIRANNSLDANTGGSITGTIGITGNVIGSYVVANSGFTSTAGSSKLELTDIGLVVIDVASQQFKFGAAGIEASPGIYGGSFGGNKLSLNNETNLISDRFDMVKISTGENGTVKNEFTFANNAFTAPGRITAISFVANGPGGINIAPTLASSYDHANAAFDLANNATGAVVTYAEQPPASGNSNGHIWIDSTDGTEYMYFKDVDGFQWVEFGPSSSNVSTNTYITADISAPYAHANAAYNQANASYNQANAATIQANAAFVQANSSITSDRLTSNLKLNIIQVLESANLYTTAIGGNVNIDIGNNTSYFFSSNTTANVTFNIRGNTTTTFDTTVAIGQTASVAIALKQGATKYKANVYIDGVLQTPYWLGNAAPNYATTQPQSIDVYTYTIFKTAANAYSILAANSNFGLAQGQPGQG